MVIISEHCPEMHWSEALVRGLVAPVPRRGRDVSILYSGMFFFQAASAIVLNRNTLRFPAAALSGNIRVARGGPLALPHRIAFRDASSRRQPTGFALAS
jgi:hypothetical protein